MGRNQYVQRCGCGRKKIDGMCTANPPCVPKPHRRLASAERSVRERVRARMKGAG